MNRFYITTPIYYVNSDLHLGHAYTTVLADVFSRYHREMGDEVRFVTGTDEHGQKVLEAARKLGIAPRAHCDEMSARYKVLWTKLKINYDRFIRTTDADHVSRVIQALQQLHKDGHLYEKDYVGWYDVKSERYFTEKDLVDGKSPDGNAVTELHEKNWFFRMSAFQQWLVDHIQQNPGFIQPESRRNEVLGFLKKPLEDLCISRPKSRMDWGIELPFDKDYVCYVWVDALLNYVSASGNPERDDAAGPWWPASTHLIGKDILITHCVYWITLLKALDLDPPDSLLAHGWWLVDNQKMSKSDGNVIDPLAMVDTLGVDAFRFFLIREMVPWNDASFSYESIIKRLNTDLANDLGNLLSRVTNLAAKNFGGKLPAAESTHTGLQAGWQNLLANWQNKVRSNNLHGLLEEVFLQIREANRGMEKHAPWKLLKTDPGKAAEMLAETAECLRLSACLLLPVMPGKALEILERLGCADTQSMQWSTSHEFRVVHGAPVFPRIDPKTFLKQLAPAGTKAKPNEKDEGAGLIDFDVFGQVKLVAALVLSADKVEGADRLLKLQIDTGKDKRQIIAGIASHYSAEDLPGTMVCVVANLKPAVIRGVESHGMLLAAKTRKKMILIHPGDVPPGTPIG